MHALYRCHPWSLSIRQFQRGQSEIGQRSVGDKGVTGELEAGELGQHSQPRLEELPNRKSAASMPWWNAADLCLSSHWLALLSMAIGSS